MNVNETSSQEYLADDNQLAELQAEFIIDSLLTLSPNGENGNQEYSIKIGEETVTGGIDKIRKALLYTNDEDQFKNRDAIQKIYDQQAATIADNYKIKKEHPGGLNNYKKLYDTATGVLGITNRKIINDRNFLTASKINKKTYDLTRDEARMDDNIKNMMDKGGMPDIYDETSSVPRILSEEEYVNLVVEGIKNKEITNIDQGGFTWDDGTSNKDYMAWIAVPTGQSYQVKTHDGYVTKPLTERKWMIDMEAVRSEAGQVYKALYTTHNTGLVSGNYPVATYKSIERGLDNTVGNLAIVPTYGAPIDPKVPNAAGNKTLATMVNQVAVLKAKGVPPTYILGDLNKGADIDKKSTLAERVQALFEADYINWYNPDSSNSAKIQPRAEIKYSHTYADPEDLKKNTAGYIMKYHGDWLASKAKGPDNNEIGSLTKAEIQSLQGGTSIIFPQDEDINKRSLRNENAYISPITSLIMASENGYVDFNPMGADSISTGTYRFIKISDNHYQVNAQYNEYQEGGTYRLTEPDIKQIPIKPGAAGNHTLERLVDKLNINYSVVGERNRLAAIKDNAVNGVK
jgi:hypothetical protein